MQCYKCHELYTTCLHCLPEVLCATAKNYRAVTRLQLSQVIAGCRREISGLFWKCCKCPQQPVYIRYTALCGESAPSWTFQGCLWAVRDSSKLGHMAKLRHSSKAVLKKLCVCRNPTDHDKKFGSANMEMTVKIFIFFKFSRLPTLSITLRAETFAGRNFRFFREFWPFSRKFMPLKI